MDCDIVCRYSEILLWAAFCRRRCFSRSEPALLLLGRFLTYKGIPTSNPASGRCLRGFVDANGRSCRRVSAFGRHAIRIARSAIECYWNASRSRRAVWRVGEGVTESSVSLCRSVHSDEKSNTFHRHFVDAETEAAIPPGPETVHGRVRLPGGSIRTKSRDHFAEAKDAGFPNSKKTMKKYGVQLSAIFPLTTAHGKVGDAAPLAVRLRIIYTSEEFTFLSAVAERLLSHSTMHCIGCSASLTAAVGEEERAPWTSTGIDQSCGFQSQFRTFSEP